MVSGATYDPATGEVSGYRNGTPIVYRYDYSTIQNGEAVKEPSIKIEGSNEIAKFE